VTPRAKTKASTQPRSSNESLEASCSSMEAHLIELGWREEKTESPWKWYWPQLPAAHYRLEDAVIVAKHMKVKG
jgi:hypothetical protein